MYLPDQKNDLSYFLHLLVLLPEVSVLKIQVIVQPRFRTWTGWNNLYQDIQEHHI